MSPYLGLKQKVGRLFTRDYSVNNLYTSYILESNWSRSTSLIVLRHSIIRHNRLGERVMMERMFRLVMDCILANKLRAIMLQFNLPKKCDVGPSEDGSPRRGYPPERDLNTEEGSTNKHIHRNRLFLPRLGFEPGNSGNSDIAMTTTPSAHGLFPRKIPLRFFSTTKMRVQMEI